MYTDIMNHSVICWEFKWLLC